MKYNQNTSFPVGYHKFHEKQLYNFQLNRWYSIGYAISVKGTVLLTIHLLILTISYNKVNLIEVAYPCIPVASHTQA
jgi:hypothetical protein